MPAIKHGYGDEPSQFGELWLPRDAPPPAGWPVVVLLHGGFWKAAYGLELMDNLASDLAERGFAAWNVEYRRVELDGSGGWPNAGDDVIAAIEHLATLHGVDPRRFVVVGHSAGGHLGLWSGLSGRLSVAPRSVIGLAPVADPADCAAHDVGNGDIERFLGHPIDASVSPAELLPTSVRQLIVQGTIDEDVPVERTRAYVSRAQESGSPIIAVELDGVGHMELIDPGHTSWATSVAELTAALRPNIALTGFMATGKTTVGNVLAAQLRYTFVDTDVLIEADHGPVPDIFADRGEAGFRELERQAVESLAGQSGLVIATGGGLVTNAATAAELERIATVVTLTAPAETIVRRVAAEGETRPLLAGPSPQDRVRELLDDRADVYGRYPAVDADRPAEDVAADIVQMVI